ncbi:MAG TPA: endonuclease/exonuclease/phosphatase family protein, partial [Candidatus Limnocylindria bacterium]|nr:endonuclease/exonuclease/phosphatase family protein [Candidatus Limnocylindria bacterium]
SPGAVRSQTIDVHDIQGAGHISPLNNQLVSGLDGIVTAVSSNGFWIAEPAPDSDPATSEGLFVFRGSATKPAVGQLVSVAGRVSEFRAGGSGGFENLALTQISATGSTGGFTVLPGEGALPLTVVGVDRIPPTEVIDNDTAGAVDGAGAGPFDPAQDGIDFWESLEGMRISVAGAVAVGPRNNFGEIPVAPSAIASVRTPRGGLIVRQLGPAGDYRPGDFNPERVLLDDVIVPTVPAPQTLVDVGDTFASDPVGVLDYSFANFKLLVTATPIPVDAGLEREATSPAGPQELAIATYNVENLSAVDSPAHVARLANQIVNNLRSPDLIAIEEMQDNSGDVNEGGDDGVVAADQSWQRLIDAIVAAGGPRYAYRQIDPVNNADGGVPGGNIRVGFLFHGERGLRFVDRPGGNATTDTNVVATPNGKSARLTVSPGRVLDTDADGFDAFTATRKSLAGEFRWRGETLFVVATHFSSKGDDHPLFGRFQPPIRFTEFGHPPMHPQAGTEDGWRHMQAQVVNDFVDDILAVDPAANVIVLGDINDFDFSETVDILEGTATAAPLVAGPDSDGSGRTLPGGARVLTTLFELLPPNDRYSYVFEGNSQVLDQILVSNSILERAPTYDVVHVNAEFADQVSDHDPSVMRVAFQPRRGGN